MAGGSRWPGHAALPRPVDLRPSRAMAPPLRGVLVLALEQAAVAGEVEHMRGLLLQRPADGRSRCEGHDADVGRTLAGGADGGGLAGGRFHDPPRQVTILPADLFQKLNDSRQHEIVLRRRSHMSATWKRKESGAGDDPRALLRSVESRVVFSDEEQARHLHRRQDIGDVGSVLR